jgi:uncharacterized membrane protein
MLDLLATAGPDPSPWLGFFGRLHPGIVHFPIALLAVAALFEAVQVLKKRPEPAGGTVALTVLAAVGAAAASLFGWFLQDYEGAEGTTMDLHKWIGLGATGVAVAAAFLTIKAKTCAGSRLGLRLALFLGTGLVLATGYLGGDLVFGENHLFNVFKPRTEPPPPVSNGPLLTPSGKVDFVKEIAPILKDSCVKCHCEKKVKGKLRLDLKELAMKGGGGGKAILPGKGADSPLYTSLVEPDPEMRMPEKADPLPKEQIERIKKWIDEGAEWPDGYRIDPPK